MPRFTVRDFGTCLSFDGSTGYVTSSYNAAFSGSRSIVGWASRNNNSAAHCLFGCTGSGPNVLSRIANGSNDIGFWADSDQANITWTNAAPLNQWFHYC